MMKTKLLKLALCAMALLPIGAWADDVENRATATWLFNQYGKNLNVTGTNNVIDFDGLYVALGTRTVTSVMARLTNAVKDGDDVIFPSGYYTGLFFKGTRGAGYGGAASATEAGGRVSLRVTKPGKVYVLCRNADSGREVVVFNGTTQAATLPNNSDTGFQMITYEITSDILTAGNGKAVLHIVGMNGTSQSSCSIYGVKYVVADGSASEMSKQIVIPSCGYVTFSGPHTYTISSVSNGGSASAYYASAETANSITLSQSGTKRIAASEGFIIIGTPGETVTLKSVEAQTTVSGNLLVANLAAYALPASSTINKGSDETYYNYILVADGTSAVFKHTDGTGDLAANKAFLRTTTNVAAGAPAFTLAFGGETTDVSEKVIVKSEKFATAPVYNLNGQRVSQPTKGLYIVNGKKVIIK